MESAVEGAITKDGEKDVHDHEDESLARFVCLLHDSLRDTRYETMNSSFFLVWWDDKEFRIGRKSKAFEENSGERKRETKQRGKGPIGLARNRRFHQACSVSEGKRGNTKRIKSHNRFQSLPFVVWRRWIWWCTSLWMITYINYSQ